MRWIPGSSVQSESSATAPAGNANVDCLLSQMGTAINAGGCLIKLFVDAGMPAPHLFAETIVEGGEDSMLVPWFTATMRGVLPRLIASGVVSEDEIAIEELTEQLRQAVVESRSQIEFAPQMCAWTHV